MSSAFQKVVICGRPRPGTDGFDGTVNRLVSFLNSQKLSVAIETDTASHLKANTVKTLSFNQLKGNCDLIIVIGGDGSLLNAAQQAAQFDLPILGINRGRLGFLTDIMPDDIESKITPILAGQFSEESRFLLEVTRLVNGQWLAIGSALNDVVLLPGDIAHMIEFDIHINQQFVCNQRADGMIIATPTGSTAYALSAGGPILHPSLKAMVLVPMFPHTLSSRPIVVDSNSELTLVIASNLPSQPHVSCDGRERVGLQAGDRITVKQKSQRLRLIHPLNYNYYETLRSKLRWENNH